MSPVLVHPAWLTKSVFISKRGYNAFKRVNNAVSIVFNAARAPDTDAPLFSTSGINPTKALLSGCNPSTKATLTATCASIQPRRSSSATPFSIRVTYRSTSSAGARRSMLRHISRSSASEGFWGFKGCLLTAGEHA